MKCNTNISLGIISIILLISISILILYKNMEDNKEYNINTKEHFHVQHQLDDKVINNNNLINNLRNTLVSISIPTISFTNNPVEDEDEIQKLFADSISSQTSSISSTYTSNNNDANKYLTKLENTVTDIENIINNKKKNNLNNIKYNNIKSLNNGMEMNLFSSPNTIFQDTNTGNITNAYLVNVNNGCLSVGSNDYDVYKCNDKNPKQLFKMKHIMNETEYEKNIDKALPFDNVDKKNINYPFAMIKSTNTEECLTNNYGTLTIQPCYSFVSQRWMPL